MYNQTTLAAKDGISLKQRDNNAEIIFISWRHDLFLFLCINKSHPEQKQDNIYIMASCLTGTIFVLRV